MPFRMRIIRGTGMHEGFLPGYADSHGCIRMPSTMDEAFFRKV
jgi:lipoprotein-anchoring transpeptidase ErfK/SrfK